MPRVNINGVNLHYQMAGEGKTIVFIHGYTGSSRDWIKQISALGPRYAVVAMDQRGHGKSGAPSQEDDYSMEIFVEDIYGILYHLNIERCCLVGHSLGGFICLEFARKYSHMLAPLVLVDTSSGDWEKPPITQNSEQSWNNWLEPRVWRPLLNTMQPITL